MEKPIPANSRRQFLGNLGAALAAFSIPASLAAAQAATDASGAPISKKTITNPYVYKFTIGKFEAWSISDGYGTFKQGVTKKMWPPAERAEMTKALVALGERPDDMTLYVNILLLRKDKEVILVDAGFGPHKNQNWGWLADAMDTIGIAFKDVTHALLSHSHIDHMAALPAAARSSSPTRPSTSSRRKSTSGAARSPTSRSRTAPTTSRG